MLDPGNYFLGLLALSHGSYLVFKARAQSTAGASAAAPAGAQPAAAATSATT
jgi:hypothetical protein